MSSNQSSRRRRDRTRSPGPGENHSRGPAYGKKGSKDRISRADHQSERSERSVDRGPARHYHGEQQEPSAPRRKRVTKDEKICQLKSALMIAQEKNKRLLMEIDNLKAGREQEQVTSRSGRVLTEEQKKFREAMRALKKVTVSQELTIKTLKAKAAERRKELKQRDKKIDALESKIASMNKSQDMLTKSSGKEDLHNKLRELQGNYDEAIRRQNDLEQMLDEKEVEIEAVQKQRQSLMGINSLPGPRGRTASGNNSDSQSVGSGASASVSTATDFDLARLKTDLAKKSQLITKLELDLEMARDELHEVKRRNARDKLNRNDASNFFPSTQLYGTRKQLDEDWGSVSECATDYEDSEFGDASEYDDW